MSVKPTIIFKNTKLLLPNTAIIKGESNKTIHKTTRSAAPEEDNLGEARKRRCHSERRNYRQDFDQIATRGVVPQKWLQIRAICCSHR